jgi:hypothetical protein
MDEKVKFEMVEKSFEKNDLKPTLRVNLEHKILAIDLD